MSTRPKLILASSSPRRLALLEQVGVIPDIIRSAELDEAPERGEWPRTLATRLAKAKAKAVHTTSRTMAKGDDDFMVIAADTVVAVGKRILPKVELTDQAIACLRLLSGRAHRVFTSVCLINTQGKVRQRLVETRVRFKRLSTEDVESYLASGEWRGKAGGYAIQGLAGAFVVKIVGSYSNVVGLPLYETLNLLEGEGYPVRTGWLTLKARA